MGGSEQPLELATGDRFYRFQRVTLKFDEAAAGDAFARKNNKSLAETLGHHRYQGLAKELTAFGDFMEVPLGEFLFGLKQKGDPLYKRFLNKHGDKLYSTFWIEDTNVLKRKGIYAYLVDGELRYLGRCRDTMRKRVNQGYGKIHPKNCYIDGQSTNWHLNAKITEAGPAVSLWFCALDDDDEICSAEAQLIRKYQPDWNIQGL